ncbi:ADP-ribosylglycohydrolase family protein [Butyrivibrio sp. CB08]|uniref:ADP-ribosylglycohydrolase family protein n=1 Tax=Butyrivibrio sp. CB08 TaxID=2364879 RepID=UPI000EA89369|nr:ADP-ribosylglycohydrolase family protein [Butyrivibrio sp. CB08]RKM62172.1 ADP-ribosylglycohydrolase family protein [Butyrivibrio sp. CB08]
MVLQHDVYRDKVKGCWMGKNIGGVLGGPFEGKRQFNDATFYVQDLRNGPPANDDLDLQIAWLAAVERYGRNVDASILGEYWLNYIIPNWVEYGQGKANLRAGLVPPLSGAVDNDYKNSNGCWIRSEIWACLAPGNPELATRYAFEDAIVDHASEGMLAEIFVTALQSAAFVESDPYKLIDIALTYIPEDSMVAKCVKKALECKEKNVSFKEAIALIHEVCPGSFGVQCNTVKEAEERTKAMGFKTVGEAGMDAPEHMGYIVIAWLYGDDFEQRMIHANEIGEDTDCTCATLGAILGIIHGAKELPAKWTDPLGDKIVTMCIDKTWDGIWVPATCTELADRIIRVVPGFLGVDIVDILAPGGYTIKCQEDLHCNGELGYIHRINPTLKDHHMSVRELSSLSSNVIRSYYPSFEVLVDLKEEPFFKPGQEKRIKVTVRNCFEQRREEWARITLHTPDGVEVIGAKECMLPLNNLWGAKAECEFAFNADMFSRGKLELLVEVQLEGRHSYGVTKVVMMQKGI